MFYLWSRFILKGILLSKVCFSDFLMKIQKKKTKKKPWLNRIFRRVFFNFPRYLLVQSVPKHLGLFQHVALFQFTICYNWSYYSFFNGKQKFNLFRPCSYYTAQHIISQHHELYIGQGFCSHLKQIFEHTFYIGLQLRRYSFTRYITKQYLQRSDFLYNFSNVNAISY